MDDERGDEAWRPPGAADPSSGRPSVSPTSAPTPSAWAPPSSSGSALPPPPPPPSSSPPGLAADTAVVSTGPVAATVSSGSRWIGRGIALATAAVLLGGGGYLAITAGAADGGADSPGGALQGALESLSAEDFIGAAEFVEPTERETMIDAGLEVAEELVRLEVFADDLDLSAVRGLDLEFTDVRIEVTEVRPDMAHIFLRGGQVTASVDGRDAPFGALITERVDAATLDVRESTTTQIEASDTPIVAVRRDGRWYLSLWYSVAENARLALDEPLPDPADRPSRIGGDTPEHAIEGFVGAALELDIATAIGMLDPDEAAALYDYAPLFLPDGQDTADEFLAEARREGWQWDLTELVLTSDRDGDLATVFIESFGFDAFGPEGALEVVYSADRSRVSFVGDDLTFEMIIEGDCFSMTFDDGYSSDTQEFCGSEFLEDAGLDAITEGAFADLSSLATPGIVVREVNGRWYISPLRTGSAATITALRSVDAEALAETVDAMVDFFADPFAFGSGPFGFGPSPFGPQPDFFADDLDVDSGFDFGTDFGTDAAPTTTLDSDEPDNFLGTLEAEALLSPGLDLVFTDRLRGDNVDDLWLSWLTAAEELPFNGGAFAIAQLPDTAVDVLVLTGIPFESDELLADWANGELIVGEGVTYVRGETDWGGRYLTARSGDGIVVLGIYGEWTESAVDAMQTQVEFRPPDSP